MKFGSWTYDGWTLDLRLNDDKADLSDYIPSGEWMLVEVPAVRNEKVSSNAIAMIIIIIIMIMINAHAHMHLTL